MVAMKESKKLTETRRLGKELLESRAHVNNAPLLLATLASSLSDESAATKISPKALTEALHSLEAFFVPLVRSGEFSPAAQKKFGEEIQRVQQGKRGRDGGQNGGDGGEKEMGMAKAEAIYKKWIWDRYREFVSTMLRFVARHSAMPTIQTAALHTLMELVRTESQGEFNNQLYLKLCSTLVCSKGLNSDLLTVLVSDYFKYLDVGYYTYSNLEKIAVKQVARKCTGADLISSDDEDENSQGGTSVHSMVRNIYDVLINLPPFPEEGGELWSSMASSEDGATASGIVKQSGESSQYCKDKKKQRFRLSKAWLSFLQLPLPTDIYKKVLAQLHQRVIPFLTNPILLSDFLTSSYNVGGLISVMALNGLFILIMNYGLEYPDFYNKLYAILEPSIFVAKHRARFFELLDLCLKSSGLPAYLAAAFAKKLGRLALSAPPAGALVVIAMIHNLLRRHPSINCLVHQDIGIASTSEVVSTSQVEERKRGADPFLALEADPAKCNALQSSLWEIETLRNHYCPAVSRFVASLETDLTVRAKTTEVAISDFSSGSYTTIFAEEVSKRLKAVPLAFYKSVPTTLFPENGLDDFLGWRFGISSVTLDAAIDQQPDKSINGQNDEVGETSASESSSSEDELEEEVKVPLPKKKRR